MGSYCMEFEKWFEEYKNDIENDYLEEHATDVENYGWKVFNQDPNFYND